MIPTAEEFIINREVKQGFLLTNNTEELNDIVKSHIEFAKLHVEEALKAAAEQAEIENDWDNQKGNISKDSILNAYPLENIK